MPAVTVGKLYSDSCFFCTEMAPAWDEMEKMISGKKNMFKNTIHFKNIEANNMSTELAQLNKLLIGEKVKEPNGYPTIYKHENGKVMYYDGPREAGKMSEWVMGSKKNITKAKLNNDRKRRTAKRRNNERKRRNTYRR